MAERKDAKDADENEASSDDMEYIFAGNVSETKLKN